MSFDYFTIIYLLIILSVCLIKWETGDRKLSLSLPSSKSWQGLLSIVIILHHFAVSDFYGGDFWVFTPFYQAGAFAVAGFFMISGYGLTTQTINKGITIQKNKFFAHRFGKIVPTFIILLALAVLYRLFIMDEGILTQLSNFPYKHTILWYCWFVFAISYLYISYGIALLIFNKIELIIFWMIFCSTIYFFLTIYVLGLYYFWWATIFSFSIGMVIAAKFKTINRIITKCPSLTCCILIVGFLLFRFLASHTHGLMSLLSQTADNYLAYSVIMLLMLSFSLGKVRLLQFLGSISLEIYLIHGFFIQTFELLGTSELIAVPLTLILTTLSAYLLHSIMQKQKLFSLSRSLEVK